MFWIFFRYIDFVYILVCMVCSTIGIAGAEHGSGAVCLSQVYGGSLRRYSLDFIDDCFILRWAKEEWKLVIDNISYQYAVIIVDFTLVLLVIFIVSDGVAVAAAWLLYVSITYKGCSKWYS